MRENNCEQVVRALFLESDPEYYQPVEFFRNYRWQLKHNLDRLSSLIQNQQPDIIFIWGMWNLSKQLPAAAECLMTGKVVYYISDHWPILPSPHWHYWQQPARSRYRRPLKKVLTWLAQRRLLKDGDPPLLHYQYPICVSKGLRDSLVTQGVPVGHASVIYNGIDPDHFTPRKVVPENDTLSTLSLRMLAAGRLEPNKGIHTAIEALRILMDRFPTSEPQLTILGGGRPEYEAELHTMVRNLGLHDWVKFHSRIPRQKMPELLRDHDVLIFPSMVVEALPRMPQEAMACGLVVVGTTTGGTAELLTDGKTGLTFSPGNAVELANQITRLIQEPHLYSRLASSGRQKVIDHFNINRMINQVEIYLERIVAGKQLLK